MASERGILSLPQLGAVVAGNALEFYDFLTFSFFAVQIGAALRLYRRLAQEFFAARKRAEELIVEIVSVGENDERRVGHLRFEDHSAGIEGHRKTFTRALRMPDNTDAPIARLATGLFR